MRLMNMLMLSCRKATELMEKKLHIRLGLREKLQLFVHTQMCDACNSYDKQNYFINNALNKLSKPDFHPKNSPKKLSEDAKSKIIKELTKL